jgi:acyl-CoA thioester hydrolase
MNAQFFFKKISNASIYFFGTLGLNPHFEQTHLMILSKKYTLAKFLKELKAGDLIHIRSYIIDISDTEMKIGHEMFNSVTKVLSARFESLARITHADTHRTVRWGSDVMEKARNMLAKGNETEWEMKISEKTPHPSIDVADTMNLPETYRGIVAEYECNSMGLMKEQYYVSRFSAAHGHLLNIHGLKVEFMEKNNIGHAGLSYRIKYRHELRCHDLLIVRSGISGVYQKTMKTFHWIFNSENGEIACTADAICTLFDMKERKSVVIPEEYRNRITKGIMPLNLQRSGETP